MEKLLLKENSYYVEINEKIDELKSHAFERDLEAFINKYGLTYIESQIANLPNLENSCTIELLVKGVDC